MSSSRRDSSPTWVPRSGDRASQRDVNPVTLYRFHASIIRQFTANIGAAAMWLNNHKLRSTAACAFFSRYVFEYFHLDRGRSWNSPHAHRMCILGLVYLPYTLRKLCLPYGAQQHYADPTYPCAQNSSAVIRQYSAPGML